MENIYNVAIPEPKTEGAVLTVKDGQWQLGSGGSGGGVFYITETSTDDGYTLSASYNDIVAAVEAGKLPVVISMADSGMYFAYIVSCEALNGGYDVIAADLTDTTSEYIATDPDEPLATPTSGGDDDN